MWLRLTINSWQSFCLRLYMRLHFFFQSPYSAVKYYSTFWTHQILGCLCFVFLSFSLNSPSPLSPLRPTKAWSEHPAEPRVESLLHPRGYSLKPAARASVSSNKGLEALPAEVKVLRKPQWNSALTCKHGLWRSKVVSLSPQKQTCQAVCFGRFAEARAAGNGFPVCPSSHCWLFLAQLPPKLESWRGEASMSEAQEPLSSLLQLLFSNLLFLPAQAGSDSPAC